jgi:hypothetical protein
VDSERSSSGPSASPIVSQTLDGSNADWILQIKTRSSASLQTMRRRPSSIVIRKEDIDGEPDSEDVEANEEDDFANFTNNEERRLSVILNGPYMRSQRLIGNSNPRYRWERYWKTEEELKPMKKKMWVWRNTT